MHLRYMHSAITIRVWRIRVRGVTDDVHRRLQAQAALSGQSLNEFLLARMTEMASKPTIPELIARIREREAYTGPSVADIVREDRDTR